MSTTRIIPRAVPDVYASIASLSIGIPFMVVGAIVGTMAWRIAWVACMALAILISFLLNALSPRRDPSGVVVDDRERRIKGKAAEVGGMVLLCVAMLGALTSALVLWQQGKTAVEVKGDFLLVVSMILGGVYIAARSVAHIVLHYLGATHAN